MFTIKRYHLLLVIVVGMLSIGVPLQAVWATPVQQSTTPRTDSVLKQIHERGNILVAGIQSDFPPFGFVAEDGELAGFDVDLVQAIAELWNVQVEWVELTAADRIPLLASGEVDLVAAAMTKTRERDAEIDFSQTYFLDGQKLLVSSGNGITGINDLQGKRIAAIQGTTSIQQIAVYAQSKGVDVEIVPFQAYLPALEALRAESVEALTTDGSALNYFAEEDQTLVVLDEPFTYEPYGLGVPTSDYLFRNLVNATLQELKANGQYDAISQKWFPNVTPYPLVMFAGRWPYTFADSPVALDTPAQSLTEIMTNNLLARVQDDFPPFSYRDENGICCIGFYVDMIKELSIRWFNTEDVIPIEPLVQIATNPKAPPDQVTLVAAPIRRTWTIEAELYFSQTYFIDDNNTFTQEAFVLGVPNNDQRFADLVNFTLQEMQQDGTYARLYQQWFTKSPNNVNRWSEYNQPALVFLPNSDMISITMTISPTVAVTRTDTIIDTPSPTSKAEPTRAFDLPLEATQVFTASQAAPDNLPVTGGSLNTFDLRQFLLILALGILIILTTAIIGVQRKPNS